MKNKKLFQIFNSFAIVVMGIAVVSAGTFSSWIVYQPKVPMKLTKSSKS